MKRNSPIRRVYNFKITREGVSPVIWCRIKVPGNYSLRDFHMAIRAALGLTDIHPYMFHVIDLETCDVVHVEVLNVSNIGGPDAENRAVSGNDDCIADYFIPAWTTAVYHSSCADSHKYAVECESVSPELPNMKYPICIGGQRICLSDASSNTIGSVDLVSAMSLLEEPWGMVAQFSI